MAVCAAGPEVNSLNTYLASCWASLSMSEEDVQRSGAGRGRRGHMTLDVLETQCSQAPRESRPGPLGGNPGLSDLALQKGTG